MKRETSRIKAPHNIAAQQNTRRSLGKRKSAKSKSKSKHCSSLHSFGGCAQYSHTCAGFVHFFRKKFQGPFLDSD